MLRLQEALDDYGSNIEQGSPIDSVIITEPSTMYL